MYCVYCGKAIDDFSKFCPFCGKPVSTWYQDSNTSTKDRDASRWEEQNEYSTESDVTEKAKVDPGITALIMATLLHVIYAVSQFIYPALSRTSEETREIIWIVISIGLLIWAISYNSQFKKIYHVSAISISSAVLQVVAWLVWYFWTFDRSERDIIFTGIAGIVVFNLIILVFCWKRAFEITNGDRKQTALATASQAMIPISLAYVGLFIIAFLLILFVIRAVVKRR